MPCGCGYAAKLITREQQRALRDAPAGEGKARPMPVYKRKYKSGAVVWSYVFDGPSADGQRNQITESGFPSKKEATGAEAARRIDEQQKYDLARAGAVTVTSELPKTLANLFSEFLQQHAQENLAPKTIERYRECLAYLSSDLLAMP